MGALGTPHAVRARQGWRPGSVGGSCGVVTNLDDALAAAQWIRIRPFLPVLTREANELSSASVPLHHQ
jgi:hypothetical protein